MKRIAFVLISLLIVTVGCQPAPTPIPTPTSTSTATPLPTNTPTPLPTATRIPPTPTPEPFAIRDEELAEDKFDCTVDIKISEEGGMLWIEGKWEVHDFKDVFWCYGAKHTWIGKVTYKGYTFVSDNNDPLQFMVTKDRGYVHVKGKGSVTLPGGSVVTLPK